MVCGLRVIAYSLLLIDLTLFSANSVEAKQEVHEQVAFNEKYNFLESGPILPGLSCGWVPQGIAYSYEEHIILISQYNEEGMSRLSVLDSVTNQEISSVLLLEPDGSNHTGHVGGVTILKNSIYVSSSGSVLAYELADFVCEAPPESTRAQIMTKSETNASFCSSYNGDLLIGEFALPKKGFKTKRSHYKIDRLGRDKFAWICGYSPTDLKNPKYVLSIRQRVQGVCVTDDYVFLSMSYGRQNESSLACYHNPLGDKPHRYVDSTEKRIPLWFLDELNHIVTLKLPPMSEGIVIIDSRLAVVFESAAQKYRSGGKMPLSHVQYIDPRNILGGLND